MPATVEGNPFTFLFYDAVTSALLGQLPATDVSFGGRLNGAAPANFNVDLTDPAVQKMAPLAATLTGRTIMAVDLDGTLVGAYLIWTRPKRGRNVLNFQGAELWSWFGRRLQSMDYQNVPAYAGGGAPMAYWTAPNYDAGLIAAQVIIDLLIGQTVLTGTTISGHNSLVVTGGTVRDVRFNQPITGTNIPAGTVIIGITPTKLLLSAATTATGSTTATCGVAAPYILNSINLLYNGVSPGTPIIASADWVDPTYPISGQSTVDSIVSGLSQMGLNVGIDFYCDVAYQHGNTGDPLVLTVNLHYPYRGWNLSTLALDLSAPGVLDYNFPEDSSNAGVTTIPIGGEFGGINSGYFNPNPVAQGYPLTETTISVESVTDLNTLGELARGENALTSYPQVAATVVLDAVRGPLPPGSFTVGQQVRVVLPVFAADGSYQDAAFPSGMDQDWRITEWAVQVPAEGVATLTLTLNAPLTAVRTGPVI